MVELNLHSHTQLYKTDFCLKNIGWDDCSTVLDSMSNPYIPASMPGSVCSLLRAGFMLRSFFYLIDGGDIVCNPPHEIWVEYQLLTPTEFSPGNGTPSAVARSV
jgi:hypothetical protein